MKPENYPAHEIRLGNIRASIWENKGDQGVWFNVSVTRLYRQGADWKSTTSFGRDDLPLVSKAVEMAYTWIWKQKGGHHVGS